MEQDCDSWVHKMRWISHTEARAMGQAPPERPRPPQRMQSTELQVMPPTTKGTAFDRPAPPSRPLPDDPVPRKSQPQVPVKPPPPKKPLPSDPATQDQEELLSAVPIYTPQAVVFPSRPAPPPPTAIGGNLQAQQV
uniref:Disintegrin and metalloproteinase domain-containing protein 15-like n=1 Tax=Geotrypetes seraphini TaxID=260995 RepID=A0A6P8SEL1_GEOSA|nr:disintegrin and metalloproteinase domain-containing protein 15-like [Geotrypetes seraphini]